MSGMYTWGIPWTPIQCNLWIPTCTQLAMLSCMFGISKHWSIPTLYFSWWLNNAGQENKVLWMSATKVRWGEEQSYFVTCSITSTSSIGKLSIGAGLGTIIWEGNTYTTVTFPDLYGAMYTHWLYEMMSSLSRFQSPVQVGCGSSLFSHSLQLCSVHRVGRKTDRLHDGVIKCNSM